MNKDIKIIIELINSFRTPSGDNSEDILIEQIISYIEFKLPHLFI